MSFTFIEDGKEVQDLLKCTECGFIQVERHFDNGSCPMCHEGEAETVRTIESRTGMSNFQYRRLLNAVQTKADGVGDSIIENIRDEYNGDEFLDNCRNSYDEQNWSGLTAISGVGDSTARKIALAVADIRDWSGGKAEMSFSVA